MENVVYLDTHVVIWLYSGNLELIPRSVQTILNLNDLLISPIVKLELEYLFEIKRIKRRASIILSALKSEIGLKIYDVTFDRVIENALNQKWTRDPLPPKQP